MLKQGYKLPMQNRYKLLVSDIDGTLADGNGVIAAADLITLQNIHQAESCYLCVQAVRRKVV